MSIRKCVGRKKGIFGEIKGNEAKALERKHLVFNMIAKLFFFKRKFSNSQQQHMHEIGL